MIDFLLGSLVTSAPAKIIEGAASLRRQRIREEVREDERIRQEVKREYEDALRKR